MSSNLVCVCGNSIAVCPEMAGTTTTCSCGQTVQIPPLEDGVSFAPEPPADARDENAPIQAKPPTELCGPIKIHLLQGDQRSRSTMAALTSDAIWIQDAQELQRIALLDLGSECSANGSKLILTGDTLARTTLLFDSGREGKRWHQEIQALQSESLDARPPSDVYVPESVAFLRRGAGVPHVPIRQLDFASSTRWAAECGLQLRAAIRGADAVVFVQNEKEGTTHRTCGLAIAVNEPEDRNRLLHDWYHEEAGRLCKRMFWLGLVQVVVVVLVMLITSGPSSFTVATGETPAQSIASSVPWLGVFFVWPLAILALTWILRWPNLLRVAGLALLAVTTGRGLGGLLGYFLVLRDSGTRIAGKDFGFLLDPFNWFFIIAGSILCVRAWRLARDSRQMLAHELPGTSNKHRTIARILLAITGLYAIGFSGFIGVASHELSAYLHQPGVNPKLEQEALLALNEGVANSERGDLIGAERSYQASLRSWEELTAKGSVPASYRANLATTLYNLGGIRYHQGRFDEAEAFFTRTVAIGRELGPYAESDNVFRETLNLARQTLADLATRKSSSALEEKNKRAWDQFDAALIKDRKGDVTSEELYKEVIALWEEILSHQVSPEFRRGLAPDLAIAYHRLADVQQKQSKLKEAEENLQKAVASGETALNLKPERPLLVKDNLDLARNALDQLRQQVYHQEIDKLVLANRFADALEAHQRGIDEAEARLRSGEERELAIPALAYRLRRFASFLAHCPVETIRDTKTAIKHARRATELEPTVGDHLHILALVQYRNRDWRDSQASLDELKTREGNRDASGWFLTAMNLLQLKKPDDAKAAFRKGVEWMDERKRLAEDNPALRIQFEVMRQALDTLRREAEKLLEGKDPSGDKIG